MKYKFWFVVGSQFLYGPEVLETVEARAKEMAAELSKVLPYPLVYKVTVKTNMLFYLVCFKKISHGHQTERSIAGEKPGVNYPQ